MTDPIIESGHVGFIATFAGTTKPTASAVMSDTTGALAVVARAGDAAPGAGDATFKTFKTISLMPSGVAFFAKLAGGTGTSKVSAANDLALEGHGITLLDVQPRPLAVQLPERASQRLLDAWRGLPLRFVGNVQVARVQRFDGMVCVTTACGQSFEADQVIAATGLQPAGRLARSAGLAVDDGGITVDTATLRSSDPHIHALGDCTSIDGRAQRYIEPIARQARAIAGAVLGADEPGFEPGAVPLRVKTSSMPITLHGAPAAAGRWSVELETGAELRMVQHLDGDIVARLQATRRPLRVRQPRLAA